MLAINAVLIPVVVGTAGLSAQLFSPQELQGRLEQNEVDAQTRHDEALSGLR